MPRLKASASRAWRDKLSHPFHELARADVRRSLALAAGRAVNDVR